MKKLLLIMAIGIILVTGTVQAKVEEMVTQINDMKVKLSMEMTRHNEDGHHSSLEGEHHNSMGANDVGINLYGPEGRAITDAKIKIGYSMPPQKNMPPMNYTSRAKLDGDTYRAKLNFSMKGDWDITVYIMRPEQGIVKANFSMHIM